MRSMVRPGKSISRLPFALALTLSACTVGYAPPPSGPASAPPPSVAGHPDMTGWRLMGEAWVSGQLEREVIRVGRYAGRGARDVLVVTGSNVEIGDVPI